MVETGCVGDKFEMLVTILATIGDSLTSSRQNQNSDKKFFIYRVPYYKTKVKWKRFVAWMDMHENSFLKRNSLLWMKMCLNLNTRIIWLIWYESYHAYNIDSIILIICIDGFETEFNQIKLENFIGIVTVRLWVILKRKSICKECRKSWRKMNTLDFRKLKCCS